MIRKRRVAQWHARRRLGFRRKAAEEEGRGRGNANMTKGKAMRLGLKCGLAGISWLAGALALGALLIMAAPAAKGVTEKPKEPAITSGKAPKAGQPPTAFEKECTGGQMLGEGTGDDLLVTGTCLVGGGLFRYGNVNIVQNGILMFLDATSDFWAKSILVETGGSLLAGTMEQPIGTAGGVVTIHLYGEDQGLNGQGIVCKTDPVTCGVPSGIWGTNGSKPVILPGGVEDYFYDYEPLKYDRGGSPAGYFGYKVLAVSYGGTLKLFGKKGASYTDLKAYNSGTSWARLDKSAKVTGRTLVLDREVDWQKNDVIVLTTTDYLPAHSEQLTVESNEKDGVKSTITVMEDIRFPHNGKRFDYSGVPAGIGPDPDPTQPEGSPRTVDTRAAVALLSRSIRIVSGGNKLEEPFPDEASGYYFGGHTVFRQGFQDIELHGVLFYQMGQGGRIMHYPVHFHMARKTPPGTIVADCTVWDSMTRWYTLHATQGVTLARNVGYLSIGHGYYFEDGTETDNRLYSNIGIFARSAVINTQNPRRVPGILAAKYPVWNSIEPQEFVPFHSDIDHPTVFWIMNGWNDIEYNLAVGAEMCGACYWLVPGYNSGMSRMEKWASYASEQSGKSKAASSPLYKFVGNSCSTAMNSFNTVGNTTPCLGVVNENPDAMLPHIEPVTEGLLAPQPSSPEADDYYPKVDTGGGRFATRCPDPKVTEDCGPRPRCSEKMGENCEVTVLDRYTTAFNWTETNFAAIWLRPQWYLLVNSAISDVQNAGLSFITGGGYTESDVIPGHWAVALKDIFIGNAQNPLLNVYTSNAGPFTPGSPLRCETKPNGAPAGNFCLDQDEGISIPISTFAVNQRLFNIYDGPDYEDSNAFLKIGATYLAGCKPAPPPNGGTCSYTDWMYGQASGIPQDVNHECYLPNAAIGWKQPNGFYYPPAFHSANLFFKDVDIRHFVIEPLFQPGTFRTSVGETAARYCTWTSELFTGFTDIDRQTELNDDDGSLTGLVQTISVNQDPFFNAPEEKVECKSDVDQFPRGTAKTSPYDYVTTVEYPDCANGTENCGPSWAVDCANQFCYGVPLYREYVTPGEAGTMPSVRMMGQKISQRSTLTVNNGAYYIDTTVDEREQRKAGALNVNVFQAGQTYYTFLLFAKSTTKQSYEMYVGPNFNPDTDVKLARAKVKTAPLKISTSDSWPNDYWKREYNASTGVLKVTMNMALPDFALEYDAAKSAHCKPASFCALGSATDCGCSLSQSDSLYKDCQRVCANWAVKDVDCPEGGCYGFAVTLSPGFRTGRRRGLPPTPAPFPDTKEWNTPFTRASKEVATGCYYPPSTGAPKDSSGSEGDGAGGAKR